MMVKLILIVLAAILLSSGAPMEPPALPPATIHLVPRAAVVISGVVEGHTSGGSPAPIGEYTAYGASPAEAAANAEQLEAQIRMTATAQATRP